MKRAAIWSLGAVAVVATAIGWWEIGGAATAKAADPQPSQQNPAPQNEGVPVTAATA
jgi:hypothetical protein